MNYQVIYDGNCNLCVTLVQILENIDRGNLFTYLPMQDEKMLSEWGITPNNCEMGMILIDTNAPEKRWQGSDAAEEIGRLLPFGKIFVDAYRALPGMKSMGDNFYDYIRDNRYEIFGKRQSTYKSSFYGDTPED
ncbi:MAG: DCC1-like thiol-disulfide oxidoreductase family protein [Cyanobacteria bacterium P01_A01_bin.45]